MDWYYGSVKLLNHTYECIIFSQLWAGPCSALHCQAAPCFCYRPESEKSSRRTRSFAPPDMLNLMTCTWVIHRGLANKFDRQCWGFCLDNCALLWLSRLLYLVFGPFCLLLSHLLAWIIDQLPSMASRYSRPKVRSVIAKLSMTILKEDALSERRPLIRSETWSRWLSNCEAENCATTVLKI